MAKYTAADWLILHTVGWLACQRGEEVNLGAMIGAALEVAGKADPAAPFVGEALKILQEAADRRIFDPEVRLPMVRYRAEALIARLHQTRAGDAQAAIRGRADA